MFRTCKRERRSACTAVLAAVLLLTAGFLSPAAAQDAPAILPIDPVPEIVLPPEWDLFGVVSEISPEHIIIEDHMVEFSLINDLVVRSGSGVGASSLEDVKPGDYVGLLFDDDSRVDEIWMLRPPGE